MGAPLGVLCYSLIGLHGLALTIMAVALVVRAVRVAAGGGQSGQG